MRRISPLWFWLIVGGSLVGTFLLPPALYAWHLVHQRSLQNQLASLPGVACEGTEIDWLSKWLPDELAERLPKTSLEIGTDADESLEEMALLTSQADNVRYLGLYRISNFGKHGWKAIADQKRLKILDLFDTPTTDAEIAQLTMHKHLQSVAIQNAPLTDASLDSFARMPALRELVLHDTQISLAAIQAFAKLRPEVRIGCQSMMSAEQLRHSDRLQKHGIDVYLQHPYSYIAVLPEWRVNVHQGLLLSPEVLACLDGLGGPVTRVDVEGDFTPEVLDFIYRLPSVSTVWLNGSATISDIDSLARIASIERVEFPDKLFDKTQRTTLYERWSDKVPEPPGLPLRCY